MAAGSNAKRKTNSHYADLILHSGECDYRVCEQLQASNSGTSQPPYYGGGKHTTSHDGSYSGSLNSSHKDDCWDMLLAYRIRLWT
jgi:hypothetical protein